MNVYDFDGTIYQGDSSVDFYLYCAKKHFPIVSRFFPRFLWSTIQYKSHNLSKEELKEAFFAFVPYLADLEILVQDFWKYNYSKIYPWYLSQQDANDVIISASPEFLYSQNPHGMENLNGISSLNSFSYA